MYLRLQPLLPLMQNSGSTNLCREIGSEPAPSQESLGVLQSFLNQLPGPGHEHTPWTIC